MHRLSKFWDVYIIIIFSFLLRDLEARCRLYGLSLFKATIKQPLCTNIWPNGGIYASNETIYKKNISKLWNMLLSDDCMNEQ